MKATIEFGGFVRQTRLANQITARDASQASEMLPSNFSKLEHGALNPPHDTVKQRKIATAIGIKPQSKEEGTFFDLAAKAINSVPADIADIISREDALPLLLRTIGNKRLGKKEIERLVELVRGVKGGTKKVQ